MAQSRKYKCIGHRLDKSKKESREARKDLVTESLGAALWMRSI